MPEQHLYPIIVTYDSVKNKLSVYPDSIAVFRGDQIVWKIRNGEQIQWIQIGTAGHPFTANLPSGNWNEIPVTVSPNARYNDWKYFITYKTSQGIATLDPKIRVKPRVTLMPIIDTTLLLVVTAVALLTYFQLRKMYRVFTAALQKPFNNFKNS